jgi:hypothetical protein
VSNLFEIPDGLDAIREELPLIVDLIARTGRWVHPDTFRAFPVWYPETARGLPSYDAAYTRILKHKKTQDKVEGNIWAQHALRSALGATDSDNWTVCHIWGIDDPKFQKENRIVKDRRYYSCVGNMVWLPTPLKGFTDSVTGIKTMLRTCAYHLFGWVCEHEDPGTTIQAEAIRAGGVPDGYPDSWPTAAKKCLPINTAPFSSLIQKRIIKRKRQIQSKLASNAHMHYPREAVREVLDFWGIRLDGG